MERLAKWIVKCRVLIIVVAVALLVPSAMGYIGTRINYDILSYLPEELESMQGQNCLDREFGIASTAIITVEHMPVKELLDNHGFKDTRVIQDLTGKDRVVCGTWQTTGV